MKIHQITDLHIPDDDSNREFKHVKEYVRRQIRFVEQERPDLFVITGDLTLSDHSESACQWLVEQLPDLPTIVIPGNHDDPAMVRRLFGSWPSFQQFEDCDIAFADTSTFELAAEDVQSLGEIESDKSCLLFIHHPPCTLGEGFMSKTQALRNHIQVGEAIQQSSINYVFCGHFHNEVHAKLPGFELFLTPSPAFQVALNEPEFTQEDFEPGVRVVDVSSGKVTSNMVYL